MRDAVIAAGDRFTFHEPIDLMMTSTGAVVRETWRHRFARRLSHALAPPRLFTVTAIDRDRGTITVGPR